MRARTYGLDRPPSSGDMMACPSERHRGWRDAWGYHRSTVANQMGLLMAADDLAELPRMAFSGEPRTSLEAVLKSCRGARIGWRGRRLIRAIRPGAPVPPKRGVARTSSLLAETIIGCHPRSGERRALALARRAPLRGHGLPLRRREKVGLPGSGRIPRIRPGRWLLVPEQP